MAPTNAARQEQEKLRLIQGGGTLRTKTHVTWWTDGNTTHLFFKSREGPLNWWLTLLSKFIRG